MIAFFLNPKTILAALLIAASVATDLRTRKVPNRLILIGFTLAVIAVGVFDGRSGIWPAVASLGTAILFTFPLYSVKAIAAGDVKLLVTLSLLMSWNTSVTMIFASMVWGAALGFARVLMDGKAKQFGENLLAILKRAKPAQQNLSHIPYTVAILFGFLTSLSLASAGISWI